MSNEETQKQSSGLPSRPLIGSADAHQDNAERKTPEQLTRNLIKKWQSEESSFILYGYYLTDIADAIREAVQAEREACAKICEDTVTFSAEHINYAPSKAEIPCGWCDGLEKCASLIRARG